MAITISETLPGLFHYSMLVPPTVESNNLPSLVWPATCAQIQQEGGSSEVMQCSELEGQQFSLEYPQYNPSLGTFYRLDRLQGGSTTAMLAPTESVWIVPVAMTALGVSKQYALLGMEHIIGGYDHLLFVLGLLVIARTPRRILLTVTGFTLAHSLTLSLSALGFVRLAIAPVEATIALSIVFLAHEISQQQYDSLTYRQPLLVAFGFGLLHGLGFASALGEIGLAPAEMVLSLLFFNVGVELGQLLFIGALLMLVWLLQKYFRAGTRFTRSTYDLMVAYVIGIPAAFWMIERVVQIAA